MSHPRLARLACRIFGHSASGIVPLYGLATHGCHRCGRLVTFAGGVPRGRWRG